MRACPAETRLTLTICSKYKKLFPSAYLVQSQTIITPRLTRMLKSTSEVTLRKPCNQMSHALCSESPMKIPFNTSYFPSACGKRFTRFIGTSQIHNLSAGTGGKMYAIVRGWSCAPVLKVWMQYSFYSIKTCQTTCFSCHYPLNSNLCQLWAVIASFLFLC